MYKKQMRLQKILCFVVMIVSAAIFVYSLGIMTDLYDTLYSTMRNVNDLTQTDVPGSIVYYTMQNFNHNFMVSGIVLILLATLLFITNTHVRRRYYIANYVSTGLYAAAALFITVWAHGQIEGYKAQFLQVDFAALQEHAETWGTAYTESTFWFDAHYFLFFLLLLAAAALVANLFWKVSLMKQEAALLAQKGSKSGKGGQTTARKAVKASR